VISITSKSRYAVVAMAELARSGERPVSIKELAERRDRRNRPPRGRGGRLRHVLHLDRAALGLGFRFFKPFLIRLNPVISGRTGAQLAHEGCRRNVSPHRGLPSLGR
jgi:hypothetical protein